MNNYTTTPYGPASRTWEGASLEQTRVVLSGFLFGTNASWMLLAFIFVQTYTYYRRSELKPDPRYLQIIVYGLVVFQIGQTGLDSLSSYRNLIYGWGNPVIDGDLVGSVADNLLPLTDAVTGSIVQYYYIARIWSFCTRTMFLSQRMKIIARCGCILVGLLPLLSCGSILTTVIIVTPSSGPNPYLAYVINVTLAIWTICTAVIDTLITTCMIAMLYHARSMAHFKDTRNRFEKVLNATLQTGFITAIVAILGVVSLLGIPAKDGDLYNFPLFLLGKSYVISFLSILNARTSQDTVIRGSGIATDKVPHLPTQLSTLAFVPGRTVVPSTTDVIINDHSHGYEESRTSAGSPRYDQAELEKKDLGPEPGMIAKTMSEETRRRMSNAVANHAAEFDNKRYTWMNAGGVEDKPGDEETSISTTGKTGTFDQNAIPEMVTGSGERSG